MIAIVDGIIQKDTIKWAKFQKRHVCKAAKHLDGFVN
jgi:hypothetical protein